MGCRAVPHVWRLTNPQLRPTRRRSASTHQLRACKPVGHMLVAHMSIGPAQHKFNIQGVVWFAENRFLCSYACAASSHTYTTAFGAYSACVAFVYT